MGCGSWDGTYVTHDGRASNSGIYVLYGLKGPKNTLLVLHKTVVYIGKAAGSRVVQLFSTNKLCQLQRLHVFCISRCRLNIAAQLQVILRLGYITILQLCNMHCQAGSW
jgi:hypothetical protein